MVTWKQLTDRNWCLFSFNCCSLVGVRKAGIITSGPLWWCKWNEKRFLKKYPGAITEILRIEGGEFYVPTDSV